MRLFSKRQTTTFVTLQSILNSESFFRIPQIICGQNSAFRVPHNILTHFSYHGLFVTSVKLLLYAHPSGCLSNASRLGARLVICKCSCGMLGWITHVVDKSFDEISNTSWPLTAAVLRCRRPQEVV